MFGFGTWELAIIAGVVLLVAGPTLLPNLGRYLGRSITDLKESAEAFNTNLKTEMDNPSASAQLTEGSSVEEKSA